MTIIEARDFPTVEPAPKVTRRYEHHELQQSLAEDYRERAKRHFIEKGLILEDHQLDWKNPADLDYTHPGSDANYLVWESVNEKKDLVIVSAIPPNSSTSEDHSHPEGVVETYWCIKGEFDLHLPEEGLVKRIREGEGRREDIMPGVKHRVKTKESWALIAIFILNGGLYPPDQLHRR